MIASIRNFRVLFEIIFKGSFEYKDCGILDKTHVRFFTKKNICNLFTEQGYETKSIISTLYFSRSKAFFLNKILLTLLEDFLSVGYAIVVKNTNHLMNNSYSVCTKCVMDTTDTEIVFDENGICNHCHDYEERKKKLVTDPILREKALQEIIQKVKGKKYDCIVGISGGVDSSIFG